MSVLGRAAPFLAPDSAGGLTLVGFTTANTSSTGVVNKPAGTQSGDFIVIMGWSTDSASTWSVPSGFTDRMPSGEYLGVATKVAGGAEPSTYTMQNSGNTYSGILCATFRGPTAFDAAGSYQFSAAASNITCAAVTAVAANSILIACVGCDGNTNLSTPSGMTAVGRSLDPAAGMFYQQLTATGSTGNRTSIPTSSGYDMGSLMITLKP